MAGAAIAAAFAFWKSPYADSLIAWLNTVSPFAIGRTVDFTDLVALPMIPLGTWAASRVRPWPLPRVLQVGLAVLAPIAFMGDGRRGVLALSEDLRAEIAEQFPGITAMTFEDTFDYHFEQSTTFDIVPSGSDVESVEGAKRTLSLIVEESVLTHGLQADPASLVYYAGRRVGVSAVERDFVLVPGYENNAKLRIRVASNTPRFDELQRAVSDDLARRLNAAFGPTNVKTFHRPREND